MSSRSELKGFIHHLVVNNFKSWAGEQTIGPFSADFTAIVGSNGAGKSNLMDAISFVAGVKVRQLRGEHFKDLIYDADRQAESSGRTAFVTLAYQVGTNEVAGMEEGDTLEFTRLISANGSATYEINNRRVTQAVYNAKFSSLGVLVEARNFLVFQGDVESTAQRTPAELCAFFEQISGSGVYAAEYNRLKQEKEDFEAMALSAIQRKKEVNAERKEAKDQQEETKRHRELTEERDAMRTELALFQLRQEQEVIRKTQNDMADARDAVAAAERLESAMNEELVEAKSQNATAARDVSKAESGLVKVVKQVSTLQTQSIKKAEAATRAKTKRRENEAQLKSAREALAKQQDEIKDLKESIAGLNTREAELLQQASASSASASLSLTPDQQARLVELRKRADKETAPTRDSIDRITREAKALQESLEEHRRGDEQLQARLDEIENERAMLVKRKAKMDASIATLEQKLSEGERAEATEKSKAAEVKRTIEAKRAELEEARATLNNAKARSNESKRARKTAEVLQALSRHFDGVKGRVVDLCRPTQRKFATAVEVALGRHMDSIVVERESVALECIKYLRDQRLGVATFLPLDSVQVKPIRPDRRALQGPYRLCIDVLEVDDEGVMRAIHFAAGDTIICDSLKDARQLCFNQGMRVKTVTLEGHQISARGDMTGGSTLDARGDRFAESAIQNAREARDRLEREISELERQVAATASDVDVQMTNAANRLKFAKADCEATERKIAEVDVRITATRQALDASKPKRDELESKQAHLATQVQALMADVARIEDAIFSELGGNLKEIRALERREAEEGSKRRAMLNEVQEQRSKLESQLHYVESRDRSEAVAEAERLTKASSEQAESLSEEAAQAKTQLEEAQAQVAKAEAALERLTAETEALASKVKEAQTRTAQASKDKGTAVKRVTQVEAELTKAVARKNEIVKQAEMDDIALPTLEDGSFDFSALPARPRNPMEAEAAEQAYMNKIKELAAAIEALAPNARAEAKLQEAIARLKDSDAVLQEARDKAKEAEQAFNKVRQQRYDAYMAMFNKVSECIDGIYKELTKRNDAPMGGSAFLALEDAGGLDPFLAGVKYDVSPPNKRFRPMDQLSGGEKTVAALALLFAVHAFRPPPFFVMDEIDAALDNDNVGRVANYVRRRSRRNGFVEGGELPVQCLVISLKDNFFDRADALVGVYREVKEESSKSLTLDLTPFPLSV